MACGVVTFHLPRRLRRVARELCLHRGHRFGNAGGAVAAHVQRHGGRRHAVARRPGQLDLEVCDDQHRQRLAGHQLGHVLAALVAAEAQRFATQWAVSRTRITPWNFWRARGDYRST